MGKMTNIHTRINSQFSCSCTHSDINDQVRGEGRHPSCKTKISEKHLRASGSSFTGISAKSYGEGGKGSGVRFNEFDNKVAA
jgi:hypothetical protein